MRIYPTYHVLVISEDPTVSDRIAQLLVVGRRFEVFTCPGLAHARDVLVHWTPHVLVLVPSGEAERHAELEALRHQYPSLPVVVLTSSDVRFSAVAVEVAFAVLLVALLAVVGLLSRSMAKRQHEATRRLELHAWHLRQVVPSLPR